MRRLCLLLLLAAFLPAQDVPFGSRDNADSDPKLPNGKSQKQAIIQAEHKQSIADAQKMADLSAEVQMELQKGDANIVSLKMLKQLEEIERLAKRIHGRLNKI
jgi:hypothetical protein